MHPNPDTPHTSTPLLDWALRYAEIGLHVFPVQPHNATCEEVNPDTGEITVASVAKRPYPGTRGCKDATNNPTRIRAWWTARPNSNIGIATGHLIDVIDIDGYIGQATRARMWNDFTELRNVARVLTPRPGGMHIYVPATGRGNKAGIYPGIDYRGKGGYVLAPPSRISPPATNPGTYRLIPYSSESLRTDPSQPATPFDVNKIRGAST